MLTKIMIGYQNEMNSTTADIYQLNSLIFGAMKNCIGIEQMDYNRNVEPVVNGTKWTFENEDGMEIDIGMIP